MTLLHLHALESLLDSTGQLRRETLRDAWDGVAASMIKMPTWMDWDEQVSWLRRKASVQAEFHRRWEDFVASNPLAGCSIIYHVDNGIIARLRGRHAVRRVTALLPHPDVEVTVSPTIEALASPITLAVEPIQIRAQP